MKNESNLLMENYCLITLEELDSSLKESFDTLPYDDYLKNKIKLRRRRYSIGYLEGDAILWNTSNAVFHQNKAINPYLGGIERNYEPLCNIMKLVLGEKLIPTIMRYLPEQDYNIGAHQIRVMADDDTMGYPAPEGIHQDGFDYIAIALITAENVAGGNSILLNSNQHGDILYERILKPRDCLILNDRKLFHYASPIVPKLPGNCYRDTIVITFENRLKLEGSNRQII